MPNSFSVKETKQWNDVTSVDIESWNVFLSWQFPSCRLHPLPCCDPRKAQCALSKYICICLMYRPAHVGFTLQHVWGSARPWSGSLFAGTEFNGIRDWSWGLGLPIFLFNFYRIGKCWLDPPSNFWGTLSSIVLKNKNQNSTQHWT